MANIQIQKTLLESAILILEHMEVEVTGVYMPTEDTDAGVELEGKYILQIADYHNPKFILDDLNMEEIGCFHTVSELVQFLREKDEANN